MKNYILKNVMYSKKIENKNRFADFYLQNIAIVMLCVLFLISSGCGKQNTTFDENGDKSALLPDGNDEEKDGNDEEKDDNDEELTSFAGTIWKLSGIIDYGSGIFKEKLDPEDCEDCYTLWFDTDHTVTVISIGNRMKLDLLNLEPRNFHDQISNKMIFCAKYDKDGKDYCDHDNFYKSVLATGSYSVTGDELRLFRHVPCPERNPLDNNWIVSSNYYTLFKRIKDTPPTTLRGTKWKLSGMVDIQTEILTELEPKNCDECYSLEFFGDSVFQYKSIWAREVLDLSNLDFIHDPNKPWGYGDELSPLSAETWHNDPQIGGDGKTYEDSYIFRYGIAYTKYYILSKGELKLFFSYKEKNYYLLFKCILE